MKVRSLLCLFIFVACVEINQKYELPVLGREKIIKREENGNVFYDTIPHSIAPFAFYNQDSVLITKDYLSEKIYVADFFFTSCPTICPVMKQQLMRVNDIFKEEKSFLIVSHTIDPKHDDVLLLRQYAEKLGVNSNNWHFLTGNQDEIYELAETSYMVVADEDSDAPGGYIHSGAFLLVDGKGRIRGVYDGTVAEQVDLMIKDIKRLLMDK